MYNGDGGRLMLLTFPTLILLFNTGSCTPCPGGCAGGCKEAHCTSCIAGRWGKTCERSCFSPNCFGSKCDRRNGLCTQGCKSGFVVILTETFDNAETFQICHYKCPHTCRTCEVNSRFTYDVQCNSCNGGYTGYPHCQYSCVGCIDTLCDATVGSGQCTLGCMKGYFTSSALNYSDRLYIPDKTSVAEISICNKCKDNCSSCASLESCTSCIPGTYGQSCEHPCDPNCRNTACNLTTGICENGCSSGYYTNGTTCESCPMCDDCRTDQCKSSCCQATTPSICSVENCDICSEIDLDLCKDCIDGYRVTGNGTCDSNGGKLKGNISICSVRYCDVCSEIDLDLCKDCLDGYRVTGNGTCESNGGVLTSDSTKEYDDDVVIGVAIGSSIFVLALVAGIVVAIFIIMKKRLRQTPGNQTETREHIYLNEAVQGSSRNYDAKNNVGNSGNINGESRSKMNTILTNSDDIDQHEYECVNNSDQRTVDYEALKPVTRDEHVYGVAEESAYIN